MAKLAKAQQKKEQCEFGCIHSAKMRCDRCGKFACALLHSADNDYCHECKHEIRCPKRSK